MRYDIQELQTDDIKSAKGMSMHPFLQLPRPTDFSVSSLLTAGNGGSAGANVNSSTAGNMKIRKENFASSKLCLFYHDFDNEENKNTKKTPSK